MHQVVRENLETFYAAIEQGWESGLPEFVRREFSRYLDCSSGDMRLNPHLHVVALDGVYVAGRAGAPVFRAVGHLKTDEVADVVQVTKVRVLRALARRGVVRVEPCALQVDEAFVAREPVLANLAAAAVAGLPPAGPAERKREPVALAGGGRLEIVGELVVQDNGFDLHAKTRAGALDEEGRKRLLRYVLRPPLAGDRLAALPDHRVRLTLKRRWSDGTYALDMDALALLARLASSVPPPRVHTTRYGGVLAPAAHWRPLVIPAAPTDVAAAPAPAAATAAAAASKPAKPEKTGKRCRYIKWAQLLRLTFGVKVEECSACGGRMELRALVREPESIERFLRHQGLWSPPPSVSAARAPPYERRVSRLRASTEEALFPDS